MLKSVRQWTLSFLAVDALFLMLLLGSCVQRPVDCLELFTFPPYLFYLPVVLFLDLLTNVFFPIASLPFWAMVALIFVLGAISHAIIGAAIGWLLRARTVKPVVSFAVALAVLALSTFGVVRQQERSEIVRETNTSLWAVVDVSEKSIAYHDAAIFGAESPSTFELVIDEQGTTTLYLENTERTRVWLICYAASCEDRAVDGKVEMGFAEYVATHDACEADPTTCPYYSIGILDLFDVTHDPNGIVTMVQHYTP